MFRNYISCFECTLKVANNLCHLVTQIKDVSTVFFSSTSLVSRKSIKMKHAVRAREGTVCREEKAQCVAKIAAETKSVVMVQRNHTQQYGKEPLSKPTIRV